MSMLEVNRQLLQTLTEDILASFLELDSYHKDFHLIVDLCELDYTRGNTIVIKEILTTLENKHNNLI